MREVLTVPNDILRQKCEPIEVIDDKIKALVEELDELVVVTYEGVRTVSISAPQIGELVRMFIYRTNPDNRLASDTRVIINPTLTLGKKSVIMRETCLSIPGKKFLVRRHKIVKLRGTNIYGKYCSYKEQGIIAQIFQHECNHLDGVLIDEIGELIEEGRDD